MKHLDEQMRQWATRLRDDLGICSPASNELATTIEREVRALGKGALAELRGGSPIPFEQRMQELQAFQAWMDIAATVRSSPAVTRAQVITQNYVCFVYLGDDWFRRLKKVAISKSVTKKSCTFLTDNPIRAFRNAIAHANWRYTTDFRGLEFWARRGSEPSDPLVRFEVSAVDLNFWQAIARCTAYASFLAVNDVE